MEISLTINDPYCPQYFSANPTRLECFCLAVFCSVMFYVEKVKKRMIRGKEKKGEKGT